MHRPVKSLLLLLLVLGSYTVKSQSLDSLFFNLYTDSLKKGTYNYINVDGLYSDGKYLPLTADELVFTSSHGKFDRNSLFIDSNFSEKKVTVQVALKKDPRVKKEKVIYIKQYIPDEKLPTLDDVYNSSSSRKKKKKGTP